MNDPKENIHRDLSEYIAMEGHLTDHDKLAILKAIFEKHFVFEKALHLITEHDIVLIGSLCKTKYNALSLPLHIGNKLIGYDELRIVAMVEAFLGYMNLNHLSRKEVQINYKRSK